METKKKTKAQIERRLENAVLHVDRTRTTKSIFFADKGFGITITEDFAVISTAFHRHVFNAITSSGYSRPYLYASKFLDIALENDCKVTDAQGNVQYSYTRLFEVLAAKEDKTEHNIARVFDWYGYCIFQPLYLIGESETEMFLLWEQYVHSISRNAVAFSEKTEDMTNHEFVKQVCDKEMEIAKEVNEMVVYKKLTDEERKQEEMDALKAIMDDEQAKEEGVKTE